MRIPHTSSLPRPALPLSGRHFLAALLIGTALCLPENAGAQNTSIGKELYNTPLQAPISGGTTNSRAQYIIPGTRPVNSNAELPSPKKLKRPEDLPSISLPTSPAPARRAVNSTLPAYPRTLPTSSPTLSRGVVKVVPPVIIDSPINETAVEVAPTEVVRTVQPQAIPFGKASAPLAPVAKPAPIEAAVASVTPTAPVVKTYVPATPATSASAPVVQAPAIAPTPAPKPIMPVAPTIVQAAPPTPAPITPLVETDGALPWQNKDIATPVVTAPVVNEPIPEEVVIHAPEPAPETFAAPVEFAEVPEPSIAPLTPQIIDETAPIIPAPVTTVTDAPVPELSEKSRFILDQTPKGIAPKKEVIARSPKPVIIKREDPNAGNIPTFDVRAHEEMGLKIEVRKTNPNTNQYLDQGYENLIAGRYQIAAGYYEEALNAEPRNEMAMFGLGTTYQKLGRNDEARDIYAKLLSYNPTHLEALNNFMALVSEEAPDEAIAKLEIMAQESPDFSPIPAQIGIIHSKQGNYAAAAENLARALNLSPENNAYKYNLAIALDKLGQGEKASELYLQLIAAHNAGNIIPGDAETIRNRIIFLSQKRP